MSKKSVVERENNRVYFRKKYYVLRKYLKGKLQNSKTFQEKLFYQSQLDILPRNSSYSKFLSFFQFALF